MTSPAIDTKAAVEVAKSAAGILPQAGKTAVLDHLVSDMTPEALKALSPEAREKLLQALAGTEASPSSTQKTSPQTAQEMVDSYAFDKKTGVSTFTVPAGVTDVEAMKALNEYFRKNLPNFKRDAVYADHLEWLENLPKKFPTHCEQRDYSQARQITITGVVKGTQGENRTTQGSVLRDDSLVFSDPRDQAIAAALHACKHDGQDLFKDLWVRGSVPGFALGTDQRRGVIVLRFSAGFDNYYVAASGSPSPELKKT
jgi:hypothetical protein